MAGTIGNFLILLGFLTTFIAGIAWFQAVQQPERADFWKKIARTAWGMMTASVLIASGCLFYLIITQQFQYNVVYSYSSKALPSFYRFSSFWAGQEGSFVLWIIFNSTIGMILMRTAKDYENHVMAVVALCQFFLFSMVAGIHLGDVVIGSSPFMLLAERYPAAPMLQTPGFVPQDGNGLNDLLQNYWMVIHPPTLFVGFSTMIVPFAYAVAGLWRREYDNWVKPALKWAILSNLILIIGVTMGGYWAYETLSFGGYWAWDPVENSSFVPWLIGVASIHTMISKNRNGSSSKAAIVLTVFAYMSVIYSTFLTRSGILGSVSVHSFVDLGLYNQLILWIGVMGLVGFGLLIARYREIPRPAKEMETLSREAMIFLGAMTLAALGGVIILGTSTPVLGIFFNDNPAAVPISFYNNWSLPLTILMTLLIGLGQLFWWNKMTAERANQVLLLPLVLTIVSTVLVMIVSPFLQYSVVTVPPGEVISFWKQYGTSLMMLFVIFGGFFALYGNSIVLWRIGKGNFKMSGGAIAHIGVSLMVLGIIASSGFSNPVADPRPDQNGVVRENFVAPFGQPMLMDGYTMTYTGVETFLPGSEETNFRTRYVMEITDPAGESFTLKPVVYKSVKDQWIQNPDIQHFFGHDLYLSVAPAEMYDQGGRPGELTLAKGEARSLGNNGEYSITFNAFDVNIDASLLPPADEVQAAVGAQITIIDNATGETKNIRPIYIVGNDNTVSIEPETIEDWDITVAMTKMEVDTGNVIVQVAGVEVPREDWVLVQAYEKPLISLLWFGFFVMIGGFLMALSRRVSEGRRKNKREMATA